MRRWIQALGFGSAVAIAPAFGGAFALGEALQDEDSTRLRRTLREPSSWVSAATQPPPRARSFQVTYRIPLWVSREDSNLSDAEIDGVLSEINQVWAQAGIHFVMRSADREPPASDELVLRFIGGGSERDVVFGMYDGHLDVWTQDRPNLRKAPNPTQHPAARTASHELGHALGLAHYNHQHDSIDSLMASGRRGYRLHGFEIARARYVASRLGEAVRSSEPPAATTQSPAP